MKYYPYLLVCIFLVGCIYTADGLIKAGGRLNEPLSNDLESNNRAVILGEANAHFESPLIC